MVSRGDGVCTSININFCYCYEVELRFSDNPRQKEKIDAVSLAEEKNVCNLQMRYYF